MSNSSLVNYTKMSPNHSGERNHVIDTITIHCVVGQCSVETIGAIFASSSAQASSNYGVGYDGRIGLYVDEKNRSWCSSNAANDHRAVTIEVASDTTHSYAVKDAAYKATIKLVADICKRNKIKKLMWKADKSLVGQVDKQNMTAHRWFDAKACPGDYLYNRFGDIAKQVNEILNGEKEEEPAKPATSTTDNKKKKTVLKFAVGDVVQFKGGKHYASSDASKGSTVSSSLAKVTAVAGKGKHPYHIRKINPSGQFTNNGVYGWVNESQITKKSLSVSEIVYTVVPGDCLSTIAARYGVTCDKLAKYNNISNPNNIYPGQKIKIPTSAAISVKKSNEEIAKEIVLGTGNWGTGAQRKAKLEAAGYDYDAIQAIVNRLLK